tara:strand:+ start:917 stop:1897 length:981 start_codon:yes stop_codon:yes gene_type:complete
MRKLLIQIRNSLLILVSKSSILVGGQAVIEGVMMRVPGYYATAVRNPQGVIEYKRETYIPLTEKYNYLNVPVIRGAIHLFESLKIGTKTLQWSADIAMPEEEKTNKYLDYLMNLMAIVFAVSIFFGIPYIITNYYSDYYESEFIFNLFAGLIRIVFFIVYLLLISRLDDVQNLFKYHGAEHKTVYTFEAGKNLEVKETYNFPTQHPRCGTSFMFIVMMVAILTYATIDSIYVNNIGELNIFSRIILHLVFIPVVSGLGYEFLKISAKYNDKMFFKYLTKPGIWLQYITTKKPTDNQVEVAIYALKKAFGDNLNDYIGKEYKAEAIS